MAASAVPETTIYNLPPEILCHTFSFLADRPAPSELRLHEQPSDDVLRTDIQSQDLKSVSLVSKAFRATVLPLLFSHVLWQPKISSLDVFPLKPIPLLRFLLENRLEHYVSTFTLQVDFATNEGEPKDVAHQIRPSDLEWLWDQLFTVLDPLRFTIIAPPATLAALLNRMLFLDDAWSFEIPYHILSLARSSRTHIVTAKPPEMETQVPDLQVSMSDVDNVGESSSGESSSVESSSSTPVTSPRCKRQKEAPPCPLFTLRPWTSVLLNEGSSTRAYQTYEFFLRTPPSMLSALLGFGEFPNDTPLLPDTIVDFNYVAIFPLSSHFYALLCHLPKVNRLFVQLTPRPGNHILEDRQAMRRIDMADLWMERNTSYSYLIGQLMYPMTHNNWAALEVFESGDVADKESWDMAIAFLESSNVRNWKAERDGVLIRVDDEGKSIGQPRDVVAGHILGENVVHGGSSLLLVYPDSNYWLD